MLKARYDTNDDGKVNAADDADTVGGHTVEKDVPADAVFTDTVYDDTELAGRVSDIENMIPSGTDTLMVDNHFDQTVNLSTSASVTATFSDESITASSLIDVAVSEWGLVPEDVTVSAGQCVVTMPKADTAHSVTVRIYVR